MLTQNRLAVPPAVLLRFDKLRERDLLIITLLIVALGLGLAVHLEDPLPLLALGLATVVFESSERRELVHCGLALEDGLELVADDLKLIKEVVEHRVKVLAGDERGCDRVPILVVLGVRGVVVVVRGLFVDLLNLWEGMGGGGGWVKSGGETQCQR